MAVPRTAAVDSPEAAHLRMQMVDQLDPGTADGAWRAALATVPRHHFVPRLFVETGSAQSRWRELKHGEPGWLTEAYADRAPAVDVTTTTVATAMGALLVAAGVERCAAPSTAAAVLDAASVRSGDRVLHVGTGTGYLTALLASRLGADQVSGTDAAAGAVARARARLTGIGLRPRLRHAEPACFPFGGELFDTVVASTPAPSVPFWWLTVIRPGGRLVMPLEIGTSRALVALTVRSDGTAEGWFLGHAGLRAPDVTPIRPRRTGPAARRSRLPAGVGFDPGDPATFYVGLRIPGLRSGPLIGGGYRFGTADGSWAEAMPDGDTAAVVQGGRRRLWDEIERWYADWRRVGRPGHERFGLTVHQDRVEVWLDSPALPVSRVSR